jgi:hypothetical protein
MANHSSETTLSAADRIFMDLIQHGDDFYKIELWAPAKNWYKKALELNPETEKVKQKIAECDRLLKIEFKVRMILVAVAVAVLGLVYFVWL